MSNRIAALVAHLSGDDEKNTNETSNVRRSLDAMKTLILHSLATVEKCIELGLMRDVNMDAAKAVFASYAVTSPRTLARLMNRARTTTVIKAIENVFDLTFGNSWRAVGIDGIVLVWGWSMIETVSVENFFTCSAATAEETYRTLITLSPFAYQAETRMHMNVSVYDERAADDEFRVGAFDFASLYPSITTKCHYFDDEVPDEATLARRCVADGTERGVGSCEIRTLVSCGERGGTKLQSAL